MEVIMVTCALLINDNFVLVCQRNEHSDHPLRWEFPGGKIEPGETAESCIIRELIEELDVNFKILAPLVPVDYRYPNKQIRLIPFVGHILSGELRCKVHQSYAWCRFDQLDSLDWAEADRLLLSENYQQLQYYGPINQF